MSDPKFSEKEWYVTEPDKLFSELLMFIGSEALLSDSYVNVFQKRMALSTVLLSNKLEGTMPHGITESETYVILESFYDEGIPIGQAQPWDVDGKNDQKSSRTQLLNHLAAHQFMSQPNILKRDLEVADVLEAHRIMMENSTGMVGKGGEFRSHNVFAIGHVYPEGDASTLERGCKLILAEYNSSVRNGTCFIISAAKLFYDMITLHPFADGNGRLCRLLVSYALMRGGFPFLVPMSSHHRKSRNHYMMSILEGRCTGKLGQMRSLILTSAYFVMRNYIENKRITGR